MTEYSVWLWGGFMVFVLAMLALDLGVFNRKAHAVSMREAGIWTAVWISLGPDLQPGPAYSGAVRGLRLSS